MERLLSDRRAAVLTARFGRAAVKEAFSSIARERRALDPEKIFSEADEFLEAQFEPEPIRVINATGVLIHTNLGRSPLSPGAREAVARAASGYQSVEIDLDSGRRGSRGKRLRSLLASFLGADDTFVVNNNAAAVLLSLSATASGREVLVSRGELVAIGGSFKIPEILETSSARLHEVGTTNRTKIEDFARAFSRDVACVLTVHPSNYEIRGYTKHPTLAEIGEFARKKKIPWIHDHGAGNAIRLDGYGIAGEERIADALAAGASLVAFSGDKLFGGPQAGILAGKRKWIEACRSHPLARALRADKLTLAALFATTSDWITHGPEALPIHALASRPLDEIRARAHALCPAPPVQAEVVETRALFGGGTTPERSLPSAGLAISGGSLSAEEIARRLRTRKLPIVGRVERNRLILDFRTIFPEEDGEIRAALARIGQDLSRA
jgi:L-seryl-tRNA(Ser) seleniumtransferase